MFKTIVGASLASCIAAANTVFVQNTEPCQFWHEGSFYDYSVLGMTDQVWSACPWGVECLSSTEVIEYNYCNQLNVGEGTCLGSEGAGYNAVLNGWPDAPSEYEVCDYLGTTITQYVNTTENQIGMTYSGNSYPNLNLIMICDESLDWPSPLQYFNATYNDAGMASEFTIEVKTKYACPVFTVNALWVFLEQYYWLWAIIYIATGLFMTFAGRKFFEVASFISAFLLTTILILAIFYGTALQDNTSNGAGWGMLAACVVVGGLLGAFVMKKMANRLGAPLIGALAGYFFGLQFNTMVWNNAGNSYAVFWLFIGIFACVGAVCARIQYNTGIILGTSITGSYLVLRGIGMFAGGFQNEYAIINVGGSVVYGSTMGYLGAMAALCVIGVVVQFQMFKGMSESEQKRPGATNEAAATNEESRTINDDLIA